MACERSAAAAKKMPRESSARSTVVSIEQGKACSRAERKKGDEEESVIEEEEEESGWTTYLEQRKEHSTQEQFNAKPRKRLARQDSTLSVLSDASSGPARDSSSRHQLWREQAGESFFVIEGSLLYDDSESDVDNGQFELIERQLSVLQHLIPDGYKFHDEEMLDKAIEYVRLLQRKIEIFEMRRRGDLQERGLCLLPVSMLNFV